MTLKWHQYLLLTVFFGFFSISLLSPIASNKILPLSPDFSVHSAAIVQAKMALEEGQFPIRVAPWQTQGWGNAFFQFYSPLPYTIAGLIAKYAPGSKNPFIIYKVMIWFALCLAAIYAFRLTRWLSGSNEIGVLASIIYLTSPYFIININTRGDFTEAMAQGLLPAVIYYTLQCYLNPAIPAKKRGNRFLFIPHRVKLAGTANLNPIKLDKIVPVALVWFALATTHLITFVYTSLFVGLLLLIHTLLNMTAWKRLLVCGVSYLWSCLLAMWYLAPIAMLASLLTIHDKLVNPHSAAWLTPLPTLFSISAVSPIPLPGNGFLPIALYSSVGWPILLSVGVLLYKVKEIKSMFPDTIAKMAVILCILFPLMLAIVWSPIDFWQYLPTFLNIAQFSYRFLSQAMWMGMILFAISCVVIFKKDINIQHVTIGLFLIMLSSSSWLATNKSSPISVREIVANPDLGYAQDAYLVTQKALTQHVMLEHNEARQAVGATPVISMLNACKKVNGVSHCEINISSKTSLVLLPILYYPKLLQVHVDGKQQRYRPLPYRDLVLTGIKLLPGEHHISVTFRGLPWANHVSIAAWIAILFLIILKSSR